jgi:hypothetical protein
MLGSRKNSKPENCSKMATNPRRPVHAVLGYEVLITLMFAHKNNSCSDYSLFRRKKPITNKSLAFNFDFTIYLKAQSQDSRYSGSCRWK